MKKIVTDLNDPVEPAAFVNSVVEHYTFESYFGDFPADISLNQNVDKLLEIGNCKVIPFVGDILHNVYNVNTIFRLYLSSWTIFFMDPSPSAGAGCMLIDPKGSKWMISYRLEFQCTNNIVEYEALVQGLKK